MYQAAHPKDIDNVFDAIASDLQGGYLLAFRPPAQKADSPLA